MIDQKAEVMLNVSLKELEAPEDNLRDMARNNITEIESLFSSAIEDINEHVEDGLNDKTLFDEET